MDDIEDLQRLQTHIRGLISAVKRREKISGKSYADMTPKQAQKNGSDLAWLGMEIDKLSRDAHAAAVDCGLADARSADSYGPVDYRPSGFHHYRYQPSVPRCRQA